MPHHRSPSLGRECGVGPPASRPDGSPRIPSVRAEDQTGRPSGAAPAPGQPRRWMGDPAPPIGGTSPIGCCAVALPPSAPGPVLDAHLGAMQADGEVSRGGKPHGRAEARPTSPEDAGAIYVDIRGDMRRFGHTSPLVPNLGLVRFKSRIGPIPRGFEALCSLRSRPELLLDLNGRVNG